MKETWNLNDILKGKEPDVIIEDIKAEVEKFKAFREELKPSLSVTRLKELLFEKEKIIVMSTRVQVYYYLKFYEKTDDSKTLGKLSFLNQLMTEMGNDMQFFSLWFMELSDDDANKYLNASELSAYNYYFVQIRELKPFTKDEATEKIINLKSITGRGAFSSLYEIFTGTFKYDFDGKKDLPQEEVTTYYESNDPKLREGAYNLILNKYGKESTIISEIYKNIVLDWHNEEVEIRGFKEPISKRNMNNDIDDVTVAAMLNVIKKNVSIFKDYFKIKYDMIKGQGQDYPFSRYHLYAHYETGEETKYSYEDSKELVLNTYREFDERFYTAAKEIFDAKHVHSHPQANKRGGAFCFSIDNEMTPYIMLNHSDTLTDLFTMMHEFGHGIHGVLSKKQINVLYDTSLAMAETASIFGEMTLANKMLEKITDPEEKKRLLLQQIDRQYATIGRQAYFIFFEQFAHENIKKGITKEELDKKYVELLEEQFGDMEIPKEFSHEWNYIPHIHNSPFYCYAYAWGNLMVLALYAQYKEKGKEFIDKYVEILSEGGGKSPADLLSMVGIDPSDETFWQGGFDIIKEELNQLKKLI